jgi:hypothetical protein|tara:strand:+ start:667 stop:882 length:216 start_codon:yes stop_codon:yes gene_type:complete
MVKSPKSLIESLEFKIPAKVEHGLSTESEEKVDEIVEKILDRIDQAKDEIILNWRIVQLLMLLGLVGSVLW